MRPPVKQGADVMARTPQAEMMKDSGRFGDSEMAHVTPGEIVIPLDVQTPELIAMLKQSFREAGVPFERYVVADDESSENPETGEPEYFSLKKLVKAAAPIVGAAFGQPELGALAGGLMGGDGAAGASGVSGMSPSRTPLPAPVEAASRRPTAMQTGGVQYTSPIEEPTYIRGTETDSFATDTGLSAMTPFNPATGRREYYGCNSKNPMTGRKEYYGNSINPKTRMREFAGWDESTATAWGVRNGYLLPGEIARGGLLNQRVAAAGGQNSYQAAINAANAQAAAPASPAPSPAPTTRTIMSHTPAAQKGGAAGFFLLSDGTKVSEADVFNNARATGASSGPVIGNWQTPLVGKPYGQTAAKPTEPAKATISQTSPSPTPSVAQTPTPSAPSRTYTDTPALASRSTATESSTPAVTASPDVGGFSTVSPNRRMRFRGGRAEGGGRSGAYARNF